MKQVGRIEAENQFNALLELVKHGEDVVITQDGAPVARLVPPEDNTPKEAASHAIERIRARAKALNLGPFNWEEWKAYRDDGRP